GDYDNAEVAAARVPQADSFRHLVNVERNFRNKDYIRAAGDAAVHCDPAGIAAHDFDHHHPIVGLSCGVDPVDGLGGNINRSIETKSEVGAGQVVVDGLGDAHHINAFFVQPLGYRKRVVAADGDQGLDLMLLQGSDAFFQSISFLAGVGARSAENGAAAGKDSAHTGKIQRHRFVLHQTAPAFEKAHKFVFLVEATFAHHG